MTRWGIAATALIAAILACCGSRKPVGGDVDRDVSDINDDPVPFDIRADIPDDLPAEVGEAWIEVGGGESDFVPLSEGDTVDIIHGPQGGYHITGAWRGAGFNPRFFTMNFDVRWNDELVGHVGYIDNLEDHTEPWEYLAATVFLGEWLDPTELDGEELRLSIHIEDRSDLRLYDEVLVVGKCCIETLGEND